MGNDPAVVPAVKREDASVTTRGLRELIAHVVSSQPSVAKTRHAGSVTINQFNLDVIDKCGDTWHVIVMREIREAGDPR